MSVRPRTLCQIKQDCSLPIPKEDCKGSLPPDYEIKVPKFTNCKKEYPTKSKKPLLFHEKGNLINGFDDSFITETGLFKPVVIYFAL